MKLENIPGFEDFIKKKKKSKLNHAIRLVQKNGTPLHKQKHRWIDVSEFSLSTVYWVLNK